MYSILWTDFYIILVTMLKLVSRIENLIYREVFVIENKESKTLNNTLV